MLRDFVCQEHRQGTLVTACFCPIMPEASPGKTVITAGGYNYLNACSPKCQAVKTGSLLGSQLKLWARSPTCSPFTSSWYNGWILGESISREANGSCIFYDLALEVT